MSVWQQYRIKDSCVEQTPQYSLIDYLVNGYGCKNSDIEWIKEEKSKRAQLYRVKDRCLMRLHGSSLIDGLVEECGCANSQVEWVKQERKRK